MRATIFARMAPDQKTQLVKELQKLKWVQFLQHTQTRKELTHKENKWEIKQSRNIMKGNHFYNINCEILLLFLKLPSGDVWRRGQWLRGTKSCWCRGFSFRSWGFSCLTFYFQNWKHQLCAPAYQVKTEIKSLENTKQMGEVFLKTNQTSHLCLQKEKDLSFFFSPVLLFFHSERDDVLWSPPSVSLDTWPSTASFSSAPSSSSTRWVSADHNSLIFLCFVPVDHLKHEAAIYCQLFIHCRNKPKHTFYG